jgi:DNA (cytosine-5)-methyltransferase 1
VIAAPRNVLSLFAGIGGLDLGLERAGMTVVGQVEIDQFCRCVLAKHWPEVPRHDDVRTCVDWWCGQPRPAVHVVAGGFPCQPISYAGRGKAQSDDRWLWPEMAAVIRNLRPDYAIMENVPALLGRGMGDVLADLAAVGYDARWDCIPAAAVGAPHRRDRVFVVAYPDRNSGRLQPEPGSGCGSPAVAIEHGPGRHVADANGAVGRPETRDPVTTPRDAALPQRPAQPRRCRDDLADAQGERRGTGRAGRPDGDGAHGAEFAAAGLANSHGPRRGPWEGLGRPWPAPLRNGWWATEPDVGRVAPRAPGTVDRLRGLGNAVVPQVAEHIGRIVMDMTT